MRNVLLIINQTALPGERSYTRTLSLYKILNETGHKVRIVTSIFNHYDKQIRDVNKFHQEYPVWNVTFIREPGYKTNVSFKRIYSQCIFAKNLYTWFKKNAQDYDVVYMTMPTNEGAALVGKYCNQHHIPYVIDVRDLWPDAMRMFIKPEIIFRLGTAPMKWVADKGYSQADGIVAVSKEYLDRALQTNYRSQANAVVYQGAYLDKFDQSKLKTYSSFTKPEREFWIAYIGTLGASYDINTFIDAIHLLHQEGYKNIKAKILGRGPLESKFKDHAARTKTEVDFIGFMPYEQMAGYLCHCDAMINAIRKDAAQSIINKVSDYFASAKPVLNGCMHPEMRALIENYQAGLNYQAENPTDLANAILKLYNDSSLCVSLGENGRKLAEKLFNRAESYKKIVQIIDQVTSKNY